MCLFIFLFFSCKQKKQTTTVNKVTQLYQQNIKNAIASLKQIQQEQKVFKQINLYKEARKAFKKAEPILAFTDKNNYKALNAPNILVVEEEDATNIKINSPFGFQVIEEILYEDNVNQEKLNNIVEITKNRLKALLKKKHLHLKKYHILWLLRDQVARIALTGITGFDSPVLEQSLEEAKISYSAILAIIKLYQLEFKNKELYQKWLQEIKNTQTYLTGNFNEFNRYEFIKKHSHKQLELLKETAKDWKIEFPLTLAFNNNITSFFSKETFNINFFSDYNLKNTHFKQKVALGKKLFTDNRLSKNQVMSCATCHHKDKAFTDGLAVFPKQKRNTPTLPYAAYQNAFFHDARVGSLEGQIVNVVTNDNEFHTNLETLTKAVKKDKSYAKEFKKLYGKINNLVIRNAIVTYIKSLGTFTSKFDKNINNEENTLTSEEINGFNLFMGKAKCATCHFPPVFNGTVPPYYTDTELEAIGAPNKEETALSEDLGRYYLFHTEERKHFFKTPTVRNIAKTAPYMHNGAYKTLEKVMDFYNKGGGIGLGFNLEQQTLPSDSLHLSKKEIANIILFMKTLSDS